MVTESAASNALHDAADSVADDATSTFQKLRAQTDAVVDRVRPQIDALSGYVRDEPTKAILISAATGAALMGLIALLTRPQSRTEQLRGGAHSLLSNLRDAVVELADRAHGAIDTAAAAARKYTEQGQAYADKGQKAVDGASKYLTQSQKDATKAQKKALKAAGKAKQQAADGADTASGAMADAWQALRDQASPVVDKLRPQIDAVTSYAKDEPARAALGVAAAGAVLLGLMALINRSDE